MPPFTTCASPPRTISGTLSAMRPVIDQRIDYLSMLTSAAHSAPRESKLRIALARVFAKF